MVAMAWQWDLGDIEAVQLRALKSLRVLSTLVAAGAWVIPGKEHAPPEEVVVIASKAGKRPKQAAVVHDNEPSSQVIYT
jgi:hypothetical protein